MVAGWDSGSGASFSVWCSSAELWNGFSMWFMIPMVFPMAWTMLLLWPERCDDSMVWTMCLSMLVSMTHLWATIRGISFTVKNCPYGSPRMGQSYTTSPS
jgi:hypothetical protein